MPANSRFSDNPFRDPNLTPEQMEKIEKRNEALRIYRETGDTGPAEAIGLFPAKAKEKQNVSEYKSISELEAKWAAIADQHMKDVCDKYVVEAAAVYLDYCSSIKNMSASEGKTALLSEIEQGHFYSRLIRFVNSEEIKNGLSQALSAFSETARGETH